MQLAPCWCQLGTTYGDRKMWLGQYAQLPTHLNRPRPSVITFTVESEHVACPETSQYDSDPRIAPLKLFLDRQSKTSCSASELQWCSSPMNFSQNTRSASDRINKRCPSAAENLRETHKAEYRASIGPHTFRTRLPSATEIPPIARSDEAVVTSFRVGSIT